MQKLRLHIKKWTAKNGEERYDFYLNNLPIKPKFDKDFMKLYELERKYRTDDLDDFQYEEKTIGEELEEYYQEQENQEEE